MIRQLARHSSCLGGHGLTHASPARFAGQAARGNMKHVAEGLI